MSNSLPQTLTSPIPPNDSERLAALHRYQILDTPPEIAFDRITALAARLFDMPIALVSLVDESRAWFKSCIGFDAREVPRDETLCSFAVLVDEPLIIPDARQDDRFACNPFVRSEPGIRFYAGAPLLTQDGFNIGTLCLLDTQPRQLLSADQQATLVDLATMVVDELELRFAAQRIAQIDTALLEITKGVATFTGAAFFDALVQHFSQVLDTDYVYIGLVEEKTRQLRTISTCVKGQVVENFEYPLENTPCWEVIQQRKICCYPQNAQTLFPDAPLLKPFEIESYVAIPFFDSYGTTLGILGVMDCKPLDNVQLVESLLPIFALRIATELERQQTEAAREQLLHREKAARAAAEQANRIKDEFLAVLSHELRSPLNPILGWSKLLKTGNLSPDKTVKAIATIERNAKLQSELIEDLLDVSRILQGKLRLNASSVHLGSTVQSAIETVRLAAEAKLITLNIRLDADLNPVSGDATRLQQIVWNLLSNAVKFTPEGGQVTVRLEPNGNHAQITICDSGKGIDPAFLPHVFDYFCQEDGATTRRFGGLGLGLAIVKYLTELHGGTVSADSAGEGKGATFTVNLPLMVTQVEFHQIPASSETAINLAGLKILVVDDEPDSREFTVFVLEQAGAKVRTAASAREAFSVLTQTQIDLLLSDIGMPDMDGYTLLQQVRASASLPCGQIPAIALTAYAGEINQQQALKAGFQQHLAKPIEPITLISEIAKILHRV